MYFYKTHVKAFNFRQVASDLGVNDSSAKQLVKNILDQLKANKDIVEA